MSIYEPAEDSYLLQESLKEFLTNLIEDNKRIPSNKTPLTNPTTINNISDIKTIKILDMGTGSGIQAKTCKNLGYNDVLAVDINKEAVKELKKHKIKTIYSNLFSNIEKKQKFDLIIFNPPYLPEDNDEPKDSKQATTAGEKGYELIIKFLKQAKSHLNKNATILLLFSSLSKPNVIIKQSKQMGYSLKLLKKQKLFFEELYVYVILKI